MQQLLEWGSTVEHCVYEKAYCCMMDVWHMHSFGRDTADQFQAAIRRLQSRLGRR